MEEDDRKKCPRCPRNPDHKYLTLLNLNGFVVIPKSVVTKSGTKPGSLEEKNLTTDHKAVFSWTDLLNSTKCGNGHFKYSLYFIILSTTYTVGPLVAMVAMSSTSLLGHAT